MEKVDTLRTDERCTTMNSAVQIARRDGVGGCMLQMGAGSCTTPFACTLYNVPTENETEKYLPNVCPRAPITGQAFCYAHCKELESEGIPIGLRPFIKSC